MTTERLPEVFHYSGQILHCEDVPLPDIAHAVGTPCYVYSAASILGAYRSYDAALSGLPHRICYAVKANSNLAVLKLLADAGAGFDIVSGGELFRILQAQANPASAVFSGVGKSATEIEYALRAGIGSFHCESEPEIDLLADVARNVGIVARFSLRLNPDVDAQSHPYISTGLNEHKFGIDIRRGLEVYAHARHYSYLQAEGVSCHIGSQVLDPAPIAEAARKMIAVARDLIRAGHALRYLDLGGGIGISYKPGEIAPDLRAFFAPLQEDLLASGLTILVEPGRSIVGQAGVLLSEVMSRKNSGAKEFVIVDAGMNDLIRPALYGSYHEILPVEWSEERAEVDVVGPVCETGDFFARGRVIAGGQPATHLAIASAGAYSFSQSSNYNSRPRAAEVLVDGATWRVIRARETYEDLIRGEVT